jgi:hypothetical protein
MLPLHQSPRRPPLYWAPRPFRPNQVRTYVREMGAGRSRCLRLPARLVFRRWVDRRHGPRLPARDQGRFGVSRDRAGVPRRAARCRPGPARAAATAPPGRAVRVSALVVLEPLRRRPRAFSAPPASASGSGGRSPTRATSRSRTVAASLCSTNTLDPKLEPYDGLGCGRGGTGRHAGLRSRCRKAWGFESLRPHRRGSCRPRAQDVRAACEQGAATRVGRPTARDTRSSGPRVSGDVALAFPTRTRVCVNSRSDARG